LGGYSGKPKYYTTILKGISDKIGDRVNVLYSEGCRLTEGGSWEEDEIVLPDEKLNKKLIDEAAHVAEQSDVVILALGDNEQISREAWNKDHMGDRTDLELFGAQNELVEAIKATGKSIVAVLINGRPNSIKYLSENTSAILECWYLGQETGNAIAEVLLGDFNPGGKLPISIPRSVGHIPCFYNHKPSARRGYLVDDITALYSFGFGLSYTTFCFENLRIGKSSIQIGENTKVTVDVTNTGNLAGTEVVQMYIRDLFSSVTRPIKELKGFKKVYLEPGESVTVDLPIKPEHLAFTDINKVYSIEPGKFEIMVGNSSRDCDLQKIILTVL
jgi:beta-glucosidase